MKKIMAVLKKEYKKDGLGFSIGLVFVAFAVIFFLTK